MERDRRTIWRFTTALMALGATVLVVIVYSAHLFSEKTEQLAAAAANLAVAELKIDRVFTLVLEAESGQRGYLVTGDASYLGPFLAVQGRTDADIAAAEQQLASLRLDKAGDGLSQLRKLVAEKLDELKQTTALAQGGKTDAALAIVRSNHGRDLMTQIRELVAQEHDSLARLRQQRVGELRDSAATLTLLTLVGVIAVILLAVPAVGQLAWRSRALGLARQELAAVNDALEARVAERTRDLHRANEEIQRYAYIVSHDLRAPLVNIIGFARELECAMDAVRPLLDAPGLDRADPAVAEAAEAVKADIPEALGFIRSSTGRMNNLIAGILQLSRAGGLVLQPQAVDLEAVTRECMASVQHRLNDAGAAVEIEGRLPGVIGDRFALSQIIGNLLDNAVKYLGDDRPGRILVRGRKEGACVRIEVADNGRGVASKDHQRIFELFRRAGAQDKPGDGIGLAHVRTLARRMGGDVAVKSDGETGSIFIVTIASDLRVVIAEEQNNA